MNGRWRKLGRLYLPQMDGLHPKLASHAANPLPIHLDADTYRVFFSARDAQNRSSIGAVDIDVVRQEVVREYHHPMFEHGPAGSFYADGVSIGNCYSVAGVRYMLFMGWQAPQDGHWRGDIGRLIVQPDLRLELDTSAPFLASDAQDPISLSYPWVISDDNGGFRMWYGSTREWDAGNGEMVHTINYASSGDGHHWKREGLAIPYHIGVAQAFSRPTVARDRQGGYEMWFSYRSGCGDTYRIGYASSIDGKDWKLDLERMGMDVSVTGWDSEMVEYPFVFEHKGDQYMVYNGNGYGKSGFGLAVRESS